VSVKRPAGEEENVAVELVGQEHALGLLETYLLRDRLPPLLFTGLPGVGKRTAAIRLAQAANCRAAVKAQGCGTCRSCRTIALLRHPDVRLVFPIRAQRSRPSEGDESAADDAVAATLDRYADYALGRVQPVPDPKHRIRIELVRWLRAELGRPPALARRRFIIILHAHLMTDEAANALLKTLEEPQEQTAFILTSDIPSALPDTIRSRCRTVRFASLAPDVLARHLTQHLACSVEQARLAAAVGQGSMARALRFLAAPTAVLPGPVIEFLAQPGSEAALLRSLGELGQPAQSSLTEALLLVFREMLRRRLGLDSALLVQNPALAARADKSGLGYLVRALAYLLERDQESSLYTNPRLSAYTLLSALRFQPDAGSRARAAQGRARPSPVP
jgi:DNA polymerase-3 subunit delta'